MPSFTKRPSPACTAPAAANAAGIYKRFARQNGLIAARPSEQVALGVAPAAVAQFLPQVKNGGFDPALGGWSIGADATLEKDAERGNALVLRCTPDKSVKSTQALEVDPSWVVLKFDYWVNVPTLTPGAAVHQEARFTLTGQRANGSLWHGIAGSWRAPTKGWVRHEQEITIPGGLVKLAIAPAIFNIDAEMRVSDLNIELVKRRGESVGATADINPHWGAEPLETDSPKRGTVCLNGVWNFMPAVGAASEKPLETAWGWQRVPGAWEPRALGASADGTDGVWLDFTRETPAGWYARDLAIPAQWGGRAILLDLRRVSTDAIVFIDGKQAGLANWPGGEIDITEFVSPGKTHKLLVKVIAVASNEALTRYMGMAPGQVSTEIPRLDTRGLIGDVLLTSRPKGAHITDVFIQTSVRSGQLSLTVAYESLPRNERVALTATVCDSDGKAVKTFSANADATAGDGVLNVAWKWADPILWDIDNPHLYTLELAAFGDVVRETFGFREFRVEGRDCYLNEKKIHFRFVPLHGGLTGLREATRYTYQGLKSNGFNGVELTPWNRDERGKAAFDYIYFEEADKEGFLIIAPVLEMNYLTDKWKQPGVAENWEKRMQADMRRHRNHPSVIAWVTGFNRFGHGQDQNPMLFGRTSDANLSGVDAIGFDALARVRAFDPTRAAFNHAGSSVGDFYSSNCYLNLIPLQEREEWPSAWAKDGDLPIVIVEFGTPCYPTFHRNKFGYGGANVSEPLYTEYGAIYYGADAYKMETPEYRDMLARTYQGGRAWQSWHGFALNETLKHIPVFTGISELFNRNTYRVWRTLGMTCMIPWNSGGGWLRHNPDSGQQAPVNIPWEPGRRGFWKSRVDDVFVRYFAESARTAAGAALVENNSETLAWIAGAENKNDPAAIADKTHNYRSGDTVKKQIALINDTRQTASWRCRYTATLDGKEIASGAADGKLEAGGILLRPFEFKLPAADKDANGVITLTATIAGNEHTDTFAFRVFNPALPALPVISILDPVGETAAMLKTLGIKTTPWSPNQKATILLIGRRALETMPPETLRKIDEYIRDGGRAILMAQDPEWMRQHLGLRVARHLSRRVFPSVPADHPVLDGLTAADFVDWAGVSRLVPENDLPP
ncbi:MAG: hypothetical protein FWG05_03900, partial [Kiritimatiellaeota bacterium]|nr:hypothetical protein [Kiritimatiellota bacterium]